VGLAGSGDAPRGLWIEARRHERVRLREAWEHHRRRYLTLRWDEECPVLWLDGMLPADQGAALEAALNERAERLPRDADAVDPVGARLADALSEAVGGDEPRPATVEIHVDADEVAGAEPRRGPWLSEIEGGPRLPTETIRRLACDGRIEWLLERGGRPVGIGRRGRRVRGALRRALRHRDGGCRFPGCELKRWLHAHHLVHWSRGGPTDLENLALLCGFHHRLLHEGGWKATGHPSADLRFHVPSGRTLGAFPGWRVRRETPVHGLSPPLRR
jgi:Domain of unknown function (DUF222)/HNH endonuclease